MLPSCAATWTSKTSADVATPPNSSSSPATRPAMNVPWPKPSPVGPPLTFTRSATSMSADASTPVSTTATVTPDPASVAGAPIVSRKVFFSSLPATAVGTALKRMARSGTTKEPWGAVTDSGRSTTRAWAISKVCTTRPPAASTARATSRVSPEVPSSTLCMGGAADPDGTPNPMGTAITAAMANATSPRGIMCRAYASDMVHLLLASPYESPLSHPLLFIRSGDGTPLMDQTSL